MKSTQLKVSRRWKTQIAMQKIKHPKTGAAGHAACVRHNVAAALRRGVQ